MLMNSSNKPDLSIERNLWGKGFKLIAGVDEVGRGTIAGPVVAAAVILKRDFIPSGINDSKKISPSVRELLYDQILENSYVGIGVADVECIDTINILNATKYAMNIAYEKLAKKPDILLIDGNFEINTEIVNMSIIKGDQKSISIAAASIIAKVVRDRIMDKFSSVFGKYTFNKHKGYPTKDHIKEIEQYGVLNLHRKTFSPVNDIIKKLI
mgnify:CR=1 FL=1|tara:strand:- start:55 stop:687 length:633 start_codon:yes stop_codon:yes gene_type:complete